MGLYDTTYGAAHLGVCIGCVLYGVTNLQTFLYFRTFPDDRLYHKLGVFWLWFLDTVHLVLCVYMVYYYVVTEFGNEFALLTVHWSLKAQLILEALIISSAQTLYAIRVWKLDASRPRETGDRRLYLVPGIVGVATVAGYACSLVFCIKVPRQNLVVDFYDSAGIWIVYYANINAAIVDAVIAGSLCYLLARCRTGYTKMDSTLGWLMFYVLNTGVITCVCAVIAVVMVVALPYSFGIIAAQVIQTKLYVNSYLALTNARSSLRLQNHRRPESLGHVLRPLGVNTPAHRTLFQAPSAVSGPKDAMFPEEPDTNNYPGGIAVHRTVYVASDGKGALADGDGDELV